MRKNMLLTQLASAYFVQNYKCAVKTIAKSWSAAVISLHWGTTWEGTGERALWVQLQDWRGELFYDGWWLWDRCSIKTWLGFCFASERGGEYICKLPGAGFRIDIIKDSKDSLSARNSKYWSKKIFRDIANHIETSMARVKYPKTLASIHIGKQECPLAFEYVEDIYGDVSFQQMCSSGQYSAFQELTSVNLLEFWKILCSHLSMVILNVCSGMREVHDH